MDFKTLNPTILEGRLLFFCSSLLFGRWLELIIWTLVRRVSLCRRRERRALFEEDVFFSLRLSSRENPSKKRTIEHIRLGVERDRDDDVVEDIFDDDFKVVDGKSSLSSKSPPSLSSSSRGGGRFDDDDDVVRDARFGDE